MEEEGLGLAERNINFRTEISSALELFFEPKSEPSPKSYSHQGEKLSETWLARTATELCQVDPKSGQTEVEGALEKRRKNSPKDPTIHVLMEFMYEKRNRSLVGSPGVCSKRYDHVKIPIRYFVASGTDILFNSSAAFPTP